MGDGQQDSPEELSGVPQVDDDTPEDEEAEARAELKKITPSNAELMRLAERLPAPQEWYDE